MNIWKISFQYWMVVFVDDRSSGSLRQPTSDREWVVMDDSRLDDCFVELTERQHNVWVLCRQPLQRVVEYCMKRYRHRCPSRRQPSPHPSQRPLGYGQRQGGARRDAS